MVPPPDVVRTGVRHVTHTMLFLFRIHMASFPASMVLGMDTSSFSVSYFFRREFPKKRTIIRIDAGKIQPYGLVAPVLPLEGTKSSNSINPLIIPPMDKMVARSRE